MVCAGRARGRAVACAEWAQAHTPKRLMLDRVSTLESDVAVPIAQRRRRRTMLLLAAVAIAPVAAAYVSYYLFSHQPKTNYGTLLATVPAPSLEGVRLDGTPFKLADLR